MFKMGKSLSICVCVVTILIVNCEAAILKLNVKAFPQPTLFKLLKLNCIKRLVPHSCHQFGVNLNSILLSWQSLKLKEDKLWIFCQKSFEKNETPEISDDDKNIIPGNKILDMAQNMSDEIDSALATPHVLYDYNGMLDAIRLLLQIYAQYVEELKTLLIGCTGRAFWSHIVLDFNIYNVSDKKHNSLICKMGTDKRLVVSAKNMSVSQAEILPLCTCENVYYIGTAILLTMFAITTCLLLRLTRVSRRYTIRDQETGSLINMRTGIETNPPQNTNAEPTDANNGAQR